MNQGKHYVYNAFGELTQVTIGQIVEETNGTISFSGGTTTSYTYDAFGNVLTVTHPSDKAETKEYDQLGRIVKFTDASGKSETYVYDLLGQMTKKTDRNGAETVYTYNAVGDLIKESVGDSEVTFAYDLNGNVITITENDVKSISGAKTTTYSYDELGRQLSKNTYGELILNYTYDNIGNILTERTIKDIIGTNGSNEQAEISSQRRMMRETD